MSIEFKLERLIERIVYTLPKTLRNHDDTLLVEHVMTELKKLDENDALRSFIECDETLSVKQLIEAGNAQTMNPLTLRLFAQLLRTDNAQGHVRFTFVASNDYTALFRALCQHQQHESIVRALLHCPIVVDGEQKRDPRLVIARHVSVSLFRTLAHPSPLIEYAHAANFRNNIVTTSPHDFAGAYYRQLFAAPWLDDSPHHERRRRAALDELTRCGFMPCDDDTTQHIPFGIREMITSKCWWSIALRFAASRGSEATFRALLEHCVKIIDEARLEALRKLAFDHGNVGVMRYYFTEHHDLVLTATKHNAHYGIYVESDSDVLLRSSQFILEQLRDDDEYRAAATTTMCGGDGNGGLLMSNLHSLMSNDQLIDKRPVPWLLFFRLFAPHRVITQDDIDTLYTPNVLRCDDDNTLFDRKYDEHFQYAIIAELLDEGHKRRSTEELLGEARNACAAHLHDQREQRTNCGVSSDYDDQFDHLDDHYDRIYDEGVW